MWFASYFLRHCHNFCRHHHHRCCRHVLIISSIVSKEKHRSLSFAFGTISVKTLIVCSSAQQLTQRAFSPHSLASLSPVPRPGSLQSKDCELVRPGRTMHSATHVHTPSVLKRTIMRCVGGCDNGVKTQASLVTTLIQNVQQTQNTHSIFLQSPKRGLTWLLFLNTALCGRTDGQTNERTLWEREL